MTFTRRQFLTSTGLAVVAVALPNVALAQKPPVYAERGIAVDGTDVVAYFKEAEPVAGSANFTHQWQGAIWQFKSAENRNDFRDNPTKYAPQYGGYCAYAVSQGYTASTVPHAWKIVDGKLYLNYSRRIQRRWELDIAGRIAAGDRNWPDVLDR
ncbi:MAG: YHS domain-containing (seleno)protein [Pseudomonadota bacterium]